MLRLLRCFRKNNKGDMGPYFFILLMLALALPAAAADEPFTGVANWGGTGLMEIPTARVLREGRYRFGLAQVDPYRYYYAAISPIESMEIGLKVTEALGVTASPGDPKWSGYGNEKDKSLDLKYQFLPEGKYLPSLALGIMDPHGTRKYPAQYLVASKQIYPFDFTVGFGNGRFGKRPLPSQGEGIAVEMLSDNASWRSDGQFFFGIQFNVSQQLMLMAEYNPIQYEKQTSDLAQAKYFTEPVSFRYNFGLRWRLWDWLETNVSWQRGNQLGVNLSAAFDLGVPMIPLYDHPYREKPEYRLHPWEERLARGLNASGFSNIVIRSNGNELSIEAQNDKYYYTPRALAVMLAVASELAPEGAQVLHLAVARNGIPVVSLRAARQDVALYIAESLTAGEFLPLTEMGTEAYTGLPGKKLYRKWWDYGIRPSFRMFLNDPSGFFKYRLGMRGWVSVNPWLGASLVTGLEIYPFNTVSSSNIPEATAVRSDIVPYLQNKAVLGILMAEQVKKFPREIYGRMAAGILEAQYSGLDGEMATPFFGGRLMVGLSGSIVKKRDPDRALGLKPDDANGAYRTAFFNTRLSFPEMETAISLKAGRFLAGDRGTVVTVSKFFNGFILSAWYSMTNTDIFKDPYNRDYHDKGIAISIPLRLFHGTDTQTSYNFSLSPWTRDVAQDIDHFNNLFDYMGRNTPIYLKKDALARDGRGASLHR